MGKPLGVSVTFGKGLSYRLSITCGILNIEMTEVLKKFCLEA
jgi:hypothetical protein